VSDASLRARRHAARLRLRRGVFLVPSLLTTANIFCGFASIVMAFEGDFRRAAILIIAAAILDGLDGRVARLIGGSSEFGGEYDSLADVVSFGIAPAFIAHVWGLEPLHRYGWLLAFLFLVCGAIRLARFNLHHGATDRRWFVGLPIPMAASSIAGTVLVFNTPLRTKPLSAVFGLAVLGISFLMVSRFRYRSFKDIDLRARRPFRTVLAIVGIFVGIALNYRIACLAIAGIYGLSGPVLHLLALWRGGARLDLGAHDAADQAEGAGPIAREPDRPAEYPSHAR
jgi:CDP-diacylglycerol--serine O-phosphatidyltransferase